MTKQPKNPNWGGARPGAGNKKGVKLVDNPRNRAISFRVTEMAYSNYKLMDKETRLEFLKRINDELENLELDLF